MLVRQRARRRARRIVTPAPFNVRTRVHEYGGGAYAVRDGVVVAADFADQRLYRLGQGGCAPGADAGERPAGCATPISSSTSAGGRILAVREDHRGGGEAVNSDRRGRPRPASDAGPGAGRRPRLLQLAPPQPRWPTARLAELGPSRHALGQHHACGLPKLPRTAGLAQVRQVAGGERELIVQPDWSPDGQLYFVSDRSGWWNLYRAVRRRPGRLSARCLPNLPGRPGRSAAAGTASSVPDTILACFSQDGTLASRRASTSPPARSDRLDLPYSRVSAASRSTAAARCCAPARPDRPAAIVAARSGERRGDASFAPRATLPVDAGLSRAARARSRSRAGRRGAPMPSTIRRPIRTSAAPAGERPPLIVKSHGGPTGSTSSELRLVDPVLDLARLCGVRRQLRRQHRLRPRLSRAPERPLGRGRRRATA